MVLFQWDLQLMRRGWVFTNKNNNNFFFNLIKIWQEKRNFNWGGRAQVVMTHITTDFVECLMMKRKHRN